MAPIKFEENIKNKLNKRTIKPSEDAWHKLSEKLGAEEGKSDSKIVWWLGIAASLVGVFLVTTLFFNKDENETVLPTLVESPAKDTVIEQQEMTTKNIIVENEEPSLKDINTLLKEGNKSNMNQKIVRKSVAKSNPDNCRDDVVVNTVVEDDKFQSESLTYSNAIINEKNNQGIVTQIPELDKDKDIAVTDSEIELLLNNAQKDITLNRIKTKNTKTVDASSMLQDVETDLDQSFRDKVFNTIVNGYNTVKTAVVERND